MLSTLSNVAKRHSLLLFFILACALSWWMRIWYAIDPVNVPFELPILPLGPLLAVLIMLALIGGWAGVKTFLGRIVHWRVGLHWYMLVLGLPLLVNSGAAGLNLLLGATMSATTQSPTWSNLVVRFVFIFFLIGLGEEPAWRGYALPRLMVGRSALVASVLLGLLHIVWHLPLFGLEYDLQNGLPWALTVIAFAVLMTWLYRHTQGSLLMPALFHTSNNTTAYFVFWAGMFSGGDLLRLWWLQGGLWVVAAVIVILLTGPNLVRTPVEPEVVIEPVAGV
jgi:membrane protease YdiL (CAAX protease family)